MSFFGPCVHDGHGGLYEYPSHTMFYEYIDNDPLGYSAYDGEGLFLG